MTDLSGQVVKGYALRERIGAGGFGAVYRAYQPIVGREVAIKIVLPQLADHPDFIRRFEVEAQLVARLEHAHIVPLYDYWREPGGAYLVMRWLRGGSLRAALKRDGSMGSETVARLLEQIASALSVAHRNGIVHRDIKPDNILLDDDGNAYLADFGIAKDLGSPAEMTEPNVVMGSPAYLAPEQLLGDSPTPQSDIYSLGITLYELLTGTRPFAEATSRDLLQKQLNDPTPPLRLKRPDLPDRLNTVIQTASAKNPAARYVDVVSLATAFRAALVDHVADDSTGILAAPAAGATTALALDEILLENPYKGLRAFQEADAADFFGRDALIEGLLARLNQPEEIARFLAVVGPSGSGKSSVVKAGLIPALRRDAIPGSKRWFIVEMLPGPHPLEELEIALLRVAVNPPTSLLGQLQEDARGLFRAVGRVLPADGSELVLIIDQFEELFTLLENESARRHFLESLLAAVTDPRSRLRVIVTLRADFYDRPLLYADFGDLLRKRTEVVLPLLPDELRRAILNPAERVGLSLESGLVDAIVKDVGEQPGTLPLLQYALTELYERRQGRTLTLDAYRASGGVMGALARRAEELYAELDSTGREAARQLFLRLVTLGEGTEDTRRRVRRTELSALTDISDETPQSERTEVLPTNPIAARHAIAPVTQSLRISRLGGKVDGRVTESVIALFSKHRLLTFDRDPVTRGPTVEVAHEALIRTWMRLRGWLDASREELRIHRRLTTAAGEWANADRDTSFLATGARLDQFVDFATSATLSLNEEETAYLHGSLEERDTRRRADDARKAREERTARQARNFGRAALVLGVVGVFAVIATLVALSQAGNARQQVEEAARTLTPVPQTLTPVQITLAAGSTKVAGAQTQVAVAGATLAPVPQTLAAGGTQVSGAQTQVAIAGATLTPVPQTLAAGSTQVSDARTQIAIAGATLTPVPQTLTPAQLTLAVGATQVSEAQTAVAVVAATLTPIPPTLTTVAQQIEVGKGQIESLRLAAAASGILQQPNGNPETAALLGIRALKRASTTEAAEALSQALDSVGTRKLFSGHEGVVQGVAFSPDGKTVLTGSWDSTARLWDATTGQTLRIFSHTDWVSGVAFSPDGKTVLTGSYDGTARLWDAATGQPLRTFQYGESEVYGVAFSPDGKTVLTGNSDQAARLWDAATGQLLRTFQGYTGLQNGVAFSPDGKSALTASLNNTAQLWDAATGQLLRTFSGHTNEITGVAFSPDGRTILTSAGYPDNSARLWDAATGQLLRSFAVNALRVDSVAFAPDGKTFLTVGCASALPPSTTCALGKIQLWNVTSSQPLRTFIGHNGEVNSVVFAPDGKTFLTGSEDRTARLWDIQPTRTIVGPTKPITSVVFSPDGKTFLTSSQDGTVRLWSVATGRSLGTFSAGGDPGLTISVAFAPDGKTFFTISDDGFARLWDVGADRRPRFFVMMNPFAYSVAFSPNGRAVVTGGCAPGSGGGDTCGKGAIYLFDVLSGHPLRTFIGHTNLIVSVAFAPDGKTFLTGSWDKTAQLWDAATGQPLRTFSGHTDEVDSVAFAPDGKTVLTGSRDKTARLWDAATGQLLRTLSGHTDQVNSVAFAPDGKTIVTGSYDKTARLWDAATGQLLRTFSGHTDRVNSVAFSPDGKIVLTASNDNTVRIWDTDYRDFIQYACTRVIRDFTDSERTQYGISDKEPTCPQFATANNPLTTPMPPTAIPFPTHPIPAWTPLPTLAPSATSTYEPTEPFDFPPTPTYEPTSTSVP